MIQKYRTMICRSRMEPPDECESTSAITIVGKKGVKTIIEPMTCTVNDSLPLQKKSTRADHQ